MLRRTISIKESEAIFIFHKDSLAPMSTMCSELAINKQLDLTASVENAFGMFEDLPSDLQVLIRDFLIPSKKAVRANMGLVLADIRCFGDIKYPPDRYSVREVVHFINDYCQSKVRYQY
jgi:hypothetical protein